MVLEYSIGYSFDTDCIGLLNGENQFILEVVSNSHSSSVNSYLNHKDKQSILIAMSIERVKRYLHSVWCEMSIGLGFEHCLPLTELTM